MRGKDRGQKVQQRKLQLYIKKVVLRDSAEGLEEIACRWIALLGIAKLSWTLTLTLRFDVSCALRGHSRRPTEVPFT